MILPDAQTLALMAALLMGLWLLLRVNQQAPARAERRRPLAPAELARMVFEAARDDDLQGLRSLFLMGAEAGEVLGEQAERFLSACRGPRLSEGLRLLRRQIPAASVFMHGRAERDGSCFMHLRDREVELDIYFGKAVKVGAVWRLVEPASGSLVI